jgi:ABC-2 type transport system ATP-binding protein
VIEVSHLTKKYGSHLAVNDLSFAVEEGQIYGLLGPNGAGKSTIMNILTGYLSATSGTVTVDGHCLPEEAEAAKRCVGYLPEQPPLYPEMTVEEYLLFVAELKKVPRAARRAQVEDAARRTGLEKVLPRLIRNLSKGYRQRVGLAQAILGFPPILILDEPTVGLDPKQIIEIRDLIRTLSAKHTIILSSHILSEVQEVCDEVIIISHGRLVASDTAQHLEQQLRGSSTLSLAVRGEAEAVTAALTGLPGLDQLSSVTEEEGVTHLTLTPAEGEDPRETLFYALADARLPILELRQETASLEKVFLELTEGAPAQPEPRQTLLQRLRRKSGHSAQSADEPTAVAPAPQPEASADVAPAPQPEEPQPTQPNQEDAQ